MPDEAINTAIRSVVCPFCGAPPGTSCVSARQRPVPYLHRLRLISAVFDGFLPLISENASAEDR